MLMTTAPYAEGHQYEVLMLLCAIMGLFDGCFVTLIGPIAFDLCGPLGAGQAIGTLLGLFSLPMTAGPPVAGIIFDKVDANLKALCLTFLSFQLGSYVPAFLAAGVPPIAGSILMLAIRLFPHKEEGKVFLESLIYFT